MSDGVCVLRSVSDGVCVLTYLEDIPTCVCSAPPTVDRSLMSLPGHITAHAHIMDFFTPHPQDHFLQDTLFEKIKTLSGKTQRYTQHHVECNGLGDLAMGSEEWLPHPREMAPGTALSYCSVHSADLQ